MPDNTLKMVKKTILDKAFMMFFTAFVAIIGIIATLLWTSVSEAVSEQTSKTVLLALLALSLLVHAFALWIIRELSKKRELTPAYGAYWDDQLNAYCPSCKSLLSSHYIEEGGNWGKDGRWAAHCHQCNSNVQFKALDGSIVSPDDVKESLKPS